MQTQFLSKTQVDTIIHSEYEAHEAWSEIMRRGKLGLQQGMISVSEKLMGAALEIAVLRFDDPDKQYFDERHIIRPVRVLVEHYCREKKLDQAQQLLESAEKHIPGFEQNELLRIGFKTNKDKIRAHRLNNAINQWTSPLTKYPMTQHLFG